MNNWVELIRLFIYEASSNDSLINAFANILLIQDIQRLKLTCRELYHFLFLPENQCKTILDKSLDTIAMDIDRMRLGWRCYEDNKRGLLIKEYTKNHTVTPKIYWKVIMRIYIEESVKTIESSLARDYEYCKEGLTRFNNSQLSTDIYDVNRRICNTPVAALSITDHLDMLEVCIDERERLKTRRSQIQVYNRILRKTCDKIIRFIPLYTKSLCSQYIIQNQSAKNRIIYRKLGGRSSVLKNLTSRDISLFPSKTIKKK